MRTPILHGFCFDLERIRLRIEVGERFSPTGLELSSVSTLTPRGQRVLVGPMQATRETEEGGEKRVGWTGDGVGQGLGP
jgi:hypothetical protein